MGYAFKVCVPMVDNKGGSKIAPYSYPPNVKCEGQNQQRGRLKCTVTILSRSGTFMVACLPVVLLSPAAHTLNIQFFMAAWAGNRSEVVERGTSGSRSWIPVLLGRNISQLFTPEKLKRLLSITYILYCVWRDRLLCPVEKWSRLKDLRKRAHGGSRVVDLSMHP